MLVGHRPIQRRLFHFHGLGNCPIGGDRPFQRIGVARRRPGGRVNVAMAQLIRGLLAGRQISGQRLNRRNLRCRFYQHVLAHAGFQAIGRYRRCQGRGAEKFSMRLVECYRQRQVRCQIKAPRHAFVPGRQRDEMQMHCMPRCRNVAPNQYIRLASTKPTARDLRGAAKLCRQVLFKIDFQRLTVKSGMNVAETVKSRDHLFGNRSVRVSRQKGDARLYTAFKRLHMINDALEKSKFRRRHAVIRRRHIRRGFRWQLGDRGHSRAKLFYQPSQHTFPRLFRRRVSGAITLDDPYFDRPGGTRRVVARTATDESHLTKNLTGLGNTGARQSIAVITQQFNIPAKHFISAIAGVALVVDERAIIKRLGLLGHAKIPILSRQIHYAGPANHTFWCFKWRTVTR